MQAANTYEEHTASVFRVELFPKYLLQPRVPQSSSPPLRESVSDNLACHPIILAAHSLGQRWPDHGLYFHKDFTEQVWIAVTL